MRSLDTALDSVAVATGFSAVVRVDREGDAELAKGYGLAHRGYGVPNTVGTQFAIASGPRD
jgi:CubicO group peptidase (beta-lactamase class C family)